MINAKKNVPELRFKEFSGEWEEKRLGEIGKFFKGKNISKDDIYDEGIECIRYGELYTTYKEKIDIVLNKTKLPLEELFISRKNDILIPSSGETAIDISKSSCILKDNVALGGDINIIRTENNGIFLTYYLNYVKKQDIAKLAQGASIIHLYANNLKTLKIKFPSLSEQQKIAAFLSAIDKKIEIVDKKIEYLESYKKGLMQKLLTGKIRFPGFNDEWKEEKLGNLIAEINKNKIENQQQYEVANIKLYGKGLKHTEKTPNITKKGRPYFIINYGDILIGKQAFHCGSVAIATKDFENCVTSNAILHMIENKKKCNKKFIFYYLTNECFYNKLKMLSEGTGQKEISKTEFNNIRINIPSLPEQQKIASFLTLIDKKIELVTKKLENLKAYKKGLLQKMFV